MNYIKGYNAIRAIAIVMVLLTHLGVDTLLKMNLGLNRLLTGRTGVTIFFTLSGFLITYILLTEKRLTKTIGLKRFYLKRFLRLSPPLLIFYSMVAILMINLVIPSAPEGFLFSISYLYNFVPRKYYTGELSHTWSLGIEEQFYLLWPLLLACNIKPKNLLLLVVAIVVLCIVSHFALNQFIIKENDEHVFSLSLYYIDRWFIPAAAPIIIGCGAAIITFYQEKEVFSIFQNSYLALFFSALLYCLPVVVPRLYFSFYSPLYFPLIALGSSIFLIWIFTNQHSLLVSILEWKPLNYLGKISYSIYVFQGLFLTNGPGSQLFFQKYPLNLILTTIMATLSYELVEKKILASKKRISSYRTE